MEEPPHPRPPPCRNNDFRAGQEGGRDKGWLRLFQARGLCPQLSKPEPRASPIHTVAHKRSFVVCGVLGSCGRQSKGGGVLRSTKTPQILKWKWHFTHLVTECPDVVQMLLIFLSHRISTLLRRRDLGMAFFALLSSSSRCV